MHQEFATELTHLSLAWHIPEVTSPDVPALDLLSTILGDGRSSRLYRRVRDEAGLAVVHAGWRGILGGVLEAAVAALGGRPVAALGPAIGACCYEVGDEVAAPYRERFGEEVMRGRNLDLRRAAQLSLGRAGCETVDSIDLCTSCNPDLFFSHRRDGARTGRQGVIGLIRT